MIDHLRAAQPRPSAPPAASGLRGRARRFTRRHGRFTATLAVVLLLLVGVNLTREYGPAGAGVALGPLAALALLVLSRRSGLTWADLGLARRTWVKGALVAMAAVASVALVYAVAAAVPMTRAAFLDTRYQLPTGRAMLTALVVIPLGTVLVEEIAFRGVLQALVGRHFGMAWGLGLPSALFGCWHILPSLGLAHVNRAVGDLTGTGSHAQITAVLGAVAFTAVAGVLLGELRRRSGSLLAAGGLHWAVNGLGVLIAAVLHATASA